MAYDNEGRGVLFKNDKKQSEKQPDYNGSITIDGVEYYLSAWLKEGKRGKFLSLSKGKEKAPKDTAPNRDMDDEIPF